MKRAAFAVIGLVLLVVSPVHSADGGHWSANVRINDDATTMDQYGPTIAVDGSGNAYAVWLDRRSGGMLDIYFAYRPAGGSWGPNERVNDDPAVVGGERPKSAADVAGNAYAVWTDCRDGGWDNPDIYFSYRPAGGSWGTSVRVNDDTGRYWQNQPDIAVDAEGNAYALWADRHNSIYFSYRPAGGSWGSRVMVTDYGTPHRAGPAIAVTPSGDACAIWQDTRNSPGYYDVYGACRPAGGSWGPNELVYGYDGNISEDNLDIAVDGEGNAYAVWRRYGYCGNSPCPSVHFAYRPLNGSWMAAEKIDSLGHHTRIAVDDSETVYVVWICREGICFSHRPPGGAWTDKVSVNDHWKSDPAWPDVAVDARGNAYAVWGDQRNGLPDIYFAYRPTTVDATPPTTLIIDDGTVGDNGWFVSPVAVTLSATDNPGGSGLAYCEYSVNGGATWNTYADPLTITQEGITTVLARSADNAGNLEDPPVSAEVKIDLAPPTETLVTEGTVGNNGWFLSPVGATLWATDGLGGSGVGYSGYSLDGGATWYTYSGPFTICQEGTTTLLMRSADNAGNIEDPPLSQEVRIDLTSLNG